MKIQNSKSIKNSTMFWQALLIASAIEMGMLIITGGAMVRSFFSHSHADPNSASNNLLADIGIYFHYPSFILTLPFDLIFLAPLVQIFLMTTVLFLCFSWRKKIRE